MEVLSCPEGLACLGAFLSYLVDPAHQVLVLSCLVDLYHLVGPSCLIAPSYLEGLSYLVDLSYPEGLSCLLALSLQVDPSCLVDLSCLEDLLFQMLIQVLIGRVQEGPDYLDLFFPLKVLHALVAEAVAHLLVVKVLPDQQVCARCPVQ